MKSLATALRYVPRAPRKAIRGAADPPVATQLVYAGREAVGTIAKDGQQWTACYLDGRLIGAFPSRAVAFRAVIGRWI
jgi:hypothetical protein